jgi:hypothetical protein
VSDELDLSASDNFIAPSIPISLPLLNENEINQKALPKRLSSVRDVFEMSASDSLVAPLVPIRLSVLNETQMKQLFCYGLEREM